MLACRALIAQRHLALLLCLATLLLKLLVPTGYMIDNDHGRIAISICPGTAPHAMTMQMPGMHGGMPDHGKSKDHGNAEMPCAFSGLSAAALGAIDPIQLAVFIAFVMAMGIIGLALLPTGAPTHLRPPPTGPPSYR